MMRVGNVRAVGGKGGGDGSLGSFDVSGFK